MDKNSKFTDIKTLSKQIIATDSSITTDIPNLSFYCRNAVSEIECVIYEPVLCLILQGSKISSIGELSANLNVGDALVVSHDLPVVSKITKASKDEPYIALILSLDLGLTRSLYNLVADAPLPDIASNAFAIDQADEAWLEPLLRYVELMQSPLDAEVLAPSILREIHYRLLLSPIGRMLRDIIVSSSHASRISKATNHIKNEFHTLLNITDLAKLCGMSAASFHQHFKQITGLTPLQYQKDLRLIKAKALLLENKSVSEVAFLVGYESPTHFSREYRRKFDLPPSQENGGSMTT
ncbi:MAG: AraC family transcriptional regulator N-terminal domain-containing protein [Nitratireductor sp.]